MKKTSTTTRFILLALFAAAMTACTTQPSATTAAPVETTAPAATSTSAPAPTTYNDPFAYCAAAGTVDAPDARYVGKALPDELMLGYLKAINVDPNSATDENFRKMTIWRCMTGKVTVCNFGANLPCDSKANTDKTPTLAMVDYCKENQNSEFIPMAVTGHSVIYSWHCVKDTPEILNQISQVDAAGYLANIWYPVEPQP